jgi:predicted nuclease of predicted toxin-antitoxin system
MIFWVDAHISPSISLWINEKFPGVQAFSFRSLGLRDATDFHVYTEARKENIVLIGKDADFQKLVLKNGPPPSLIWLTCGNTSNERLKPSCLLRYPKP